MTEQRLRVIPRISVNKLAEYMTATASRRRGIIRDQKQPLDFIVARYVPVYEALSQCLASGRDVGVIHARLEKLYNSTPKKMWQVQDTNLSAEALEASLDIVDELDLSAFDVNRGPDTASMMKVAGVDVSVRPELHLRDDQRRVQGAVKLYISKTNPLDERSAGFAGTLVHQYSSEVLGDAQVDHQNCFVIDVFARKVYVAPRAFRKRRLDIGAACEEIAQRWSAF